METNEAHLDSKTLTSTTLSSELLRATVLIGIGFVLPALVHLVSSSVALGPILMPLLLPVALAAFLLPLRSALAVGVILPIGSMLATGMPPLPVVCELMAEGAALIATVNHLSKRRLHWLVPYLAGIAASRAVSLIYLASVSGMDLAASSVAASKGIVGLGLIALVLPALFKLFGNTGNKR